MPHLPVKEEGQLQDPQLRENFDRRMHINTYEGGRLEAFHPPPKALISSTLASIRRRRMSTLFLAVVSTKV